MCIRDRRRVVPLGGGKPVAVDFQLVCATHRRLREEVDAGRFREDLYYRVNGLALQLPALRQRSDLAALVQSMLDVLAPGRALQLAPEVAAAFVRYRWPGNLRQLNNVLRTAVALMADDERQVEWNHLPDDVAEDLAGTPAPRAVHDADTDLRTQGTSILLIEQNARAALEVSDYGYVLETGALALEGPADELAGDSRVIDTYLGAQRAS